jgi:hypothetical protein
MVMTDRRRKRHHFLPESYLSAWSDNSGRVAMRRRGSTNAVVTSTRNVGVEGNLYSILIDGRTDDSLERELAEAEREWTADVQRLKDGQLPRRGSEHRSSLSQLLAIQYARTPDHIERNLFPLRFAEYCGDVPPDKEAMRRFLTECHLGFAPEDGEVQGAWDYTTATQMMGGITKAEALEISLKVAINDVAPHLERMAWSIERSSKSAFLTSDRPLALWQKPSKVPAFRGIGIEGADEVRFAIGPRHLLVLRPKFPEHITFVERERVDDVNQHLSKQCQYAVVGRAVDDCYLEDLNLGDRGPTVRFNFGPLVESLPDGQLRETGNDVMHIYGQYVSDG